MDQREEDERNCTGGWADATDQLIENLRGELDFYKRRCDMLQAWRLVDQYKRAANICAAERDHARTCYELTVRILTGIHAMLYPPRFTDNDGRTWQFKSPLAEEQMQELSDRIRAIPDEIAAADEAMKTPPNA